MRKATGSYLTYSSLVKLQPWFLSLRWKTCLSAEFQLGSEFAVKSCPWAELSDDDDILDFENRKRTKFQSNWSISFGDINF